MKQAGVSVIIPNYEAIDVLRRTVACVIAECQDAAADWEILVVDNESRTALARQLREEFPDRDHVRIVRRTGLRGRHFQPGAARNIGIARARHDCMILLDSDSAPAAGLVRRYRELASQEQDCVLIGHRVFVEASGLDPNAVAADRDLLNRAPKVCSESNYGLAEDRRLAELRELDGHPHPWDVLYSCNFALHRRCLEDLRFDARFDGSWGYEDVELGYRLFARQRRFGYVPDAFVYHQEGGPLPAERRIAGRRHNFALAARLIPEFAEIRRASSRACALPGATAAPARLPSSRAPGT